MIFSLRTQSPAVFSHDESVEVATTDESSTTTLSLSNGGMTLESSQVAVVTLNPSKAFGSSAFGPLQYRVNIRGVAGDWQPLATLVRLPVLKDIKCPATAELACKLSGTNLFLIDSVSSDSQFTHPVQVPDGFLGSALPVPHPVEGPIYVKLRDDPSVINRATLTAEQLPTSPDDLARSDARQPGLATDNKRGHRLRREPSVHNWRAAERLYAAAAGASASATATATELRNPASITPDGLAYVR